MTADQGGQPYQLPWVGLSALAQPRHQVGLTTLGQQPETTRCYLKSKSISGNAMMAPMQELPKRKRLPHMLPAWVDRSDPIFVTICCKHRGLNSIAHPDVFQTIRQTLRIYEESRKLKLFSLTAMPDHIHLIARWNHAIGLGQTIKSFKGIIAKRHDIDWQQGFFDHRIRSSGELRAKTAYVRANPIRAGLVKTEADWPFAYLRGDDNG